MSTLYSVQISAGDHAQPFISGARHLSLVNFRSFLKRVMSGHNLETVTLKVRNSAVKSTGTITLASCPADQVIEINGVKFTAVNGTAVAANNEFDMSGNDTADAAALAAAINACTSTAISGSVTATSASGVVTLTAVHGGIGGNAITLKNLGILAKAVVTAASVAANDTITINGTALTATQFRATGTATLASSIAGDTITVNGVTFTGAAGAVTLGARTFSIDTDDTHAAASLAAQVNGISDGRISGVLTATSAAGVVTFRAVATGTGGNSLTLAQTGGTITLSGATLSGGAAVANNQFECTGTDTQVATDIVRAIGASTTALVSSAVYATSSAGVVTIRSLTPGLPGNTHTIATSNGTRLAITGGLSRLGSATTASYEGAAATGTVTITSGSGNYTVTINGSATGNVAYNTSDNQTASDVADAINKLSGTLVANHIIASAATNVVTITALRGGIIGNGITLACTGTGAVASGARLTGGAAPTTVVCSGDRMASGSETLLTFTY